MKQPEWLATFLLPALFTALLLQGCENDLNKVKQISSLESNTHVDTTRGAEVIYSDSAKVKARVITPLMLHHTVALPFYEMPKGVKITFFEADLNKSKDSPENHILCTIVSDYAITSNNDKLIELRKNVVVSNPAGDVLKSDELFYDSLKKIIYSNKQCWLNKADGTALDGTSFISNETFTDYRFEKGKGDIITKGNLGQ